METKKLKRVVTVRMEAELHGRLTAKTFGRDGGDSMNTYCVQAIEEKLARDA